MFDACSGTDRRKCRLISGCDIDDNMPYMLEILQSYVGSGSVPEHIHRRRRMMYLCWTFFRVPDDLEPFQRLLG